MRSTERRGARRLAMWSIAIGSLIGLASCQTTTQRCMDQRDACREDCDDEPEGKERNTCKNDCDDALNKCMAE